MKKFFQITFRIILLYAALFNSLLGDNRYIKFVGVISIIAAIAVIAAEWSATGKEKKPRLIAKTVIGVSGILFSICGLLNITWAYRIGTLLFILLAVWSIFSALYAWKPRKGVEGGCLHRPRGADHHSDRPVGYLSGC